jgi:tetratricopeptide (TPR) repeat protein
MLKSKNLHLLLMRAFWLNTEGEYERALHTCEQVLRENPKHPEALYQHGLAAQGLGKWQMAAADFSLSLSLDPDFEEARQALNDLRQDFY